MVKIDDSTESEIPTWLDPVKSSSCLFETDGSSFKSALVNGKNKMPGSIYKSNTHVVKPLGSYSTARESPLVNGNCSNDTFAMRAGARYCDEKSAKTLPTANGNSADEVLAKNISATNGNFSKNSGNHLNGSSIPSEKESFSAHNSDYLYNDNSDENGFTKVVKSRRSRIRNKQQNNRWNQTRNLPPRLHREAIKHDKVIDKNSGETTSSSHASQEPPRRNIPSIRCPKKSYSAAVANGQNGKPRPSNDTHSNIPSYTQNVIKSNLPVNESNLHKTDTSVDQLSSELARIAVINHTSVASCKRSPTSMSVQNDESSLNQIFSEKACFSFDVHESEKPSSPSDYVDSGEVSDESSNPTYSESVASNDSGTGEGEIIYTDATPYYCEFPKEKVSKLIGKKGSLKYDLEGKSGVRFWVYDHNSDETKSIITMTGNGAQVKRARELIMARFHVSLPQWFLPTNQLLPTNISLPKRLLPYLPQNVDNYVEVSCMCDPNFFWVQLWGHPLTNAIAKMESDMTNHYNSVPDAPGITAPVIGSVVAVPAVQANDRLGWIRGLIIEVISDDQIVVRYLDHGGDHQVPLSNIRQLRMDDLNLPFFAVQCTLYDILPIGFKWSDEACAEFLRLCNSCEKHPPLARVVGTSSEGYYCVTLLRPDPELNILVDIGTDLINRGFARRPSIPAIQFNPEVPQLAQYRNPLLF